MPKATPALEITGTEVPTPAPRKRRGKPIATEVHEVKRVWSEEVVIDNKPKAPRKNAKTEPEVDESDEEEIDEIYSDLPEDLAVFLQANSGAKDVTMEVRRIDGPKMDAMPGIRAGTYLGNHRFDVENHQDDLALYYAEPNKDTRFMLRLKCAGQYVPNGTIYPVDVIGASIERKAAVGVVVQQPQPNVTATINQATPPMQMIHQEPPDPMDGVKKTLTLLKEFQEIGLIPKLERNKEPVVIQQNPEHQFTEEDHIIRAAMASPDAQERVAKGIFSKLIGGAMTPDETPWYADLIKDFALSLAPGFNALMQAGAHKMVQAQTFVAQQQQAPPSLPEGVQVAPQQPAPANFQPEPFSQQPQPSPIQQAIIQQQHPEPEEILFSLILKDCSNRQIVKPEVCAKNVLAFVDRYIQDESGWTPFNAAVDIFLSNDAENIVAYAAVQNPIAARMASEPDVLPWLKSVQDEIRKEWNQDGAEEATT